MEEGIAERLRVQDRMIEAAKAQENDPGWSAKVLTMGLQITYTWQHESGNFYVVESITPWTAIALARTNPLLTAMDDLIKQKTDFKP